MSRSQIIVAGAFFLLCACLPVRANVYATDIRLNGSLQVGVLVPGSPVTISFILNDVATNVSVQIYTGTNVLKTFSSDSGEVGTNAGRNTVVWDGTNDDSSAATVGAYNIRITAAAAGYQTWTNITDDGTNFDVFFPTSIAVNKNTNSPYYGRVFIGNGANGTLDFTNGSEEAVTNGILKCNADGSPADEGGFSTGGYTWNGDLYQNPSPWKMDIGSDDRLYVDDWSGSGVVVSFDETLSTNYLAVLRRDNYPYSGILLSGLCVIGDGTNMQIYMADVNQIGAGGMGILSWMLNSNGVAATNDTGMVEVPLSTNASDLSLAPYAVSVDAYSNIYTIQRNWDFTIMDATNDLNPKALCFPPAPSGGPPDPSALWEIGQGDPTMVNNYGVAVDPTATFLGVTSRGYGTNGDSFQGGATSIFLATNGTLVASMTQDAEGNTNQEFFDVAWDNVGNLYALYGEDGLSQSGWRVYSPPGSNQ
ncbi:MAG TPA: FlgD immunoglobulin-like domain containing protein, partial [Verrucomicrobiae bacterium]|nr:FlgD immunoglobulin-like domain containing protein [Verrucomicrobiae bacterium]